MSRLSIAVFCVLVAVIFSSLVWRFQRSDKRPADRRFLYLFTWPPGLGVGVDRARFESANRVSGIPHRCAIRRQRRWTIAMFQVCLLFESRDRVALFTQGPLYQCRRSSLYLRLRFVSKEGVNNSILGLKCLDQGLAFSGDFGPKLRLLRRRSLFGEEVANDFLCLLARPSGSSRFGRLTGRRLSLGDLRNCCFHHWPPLLVESVLSGVASGAFRMWSRRSPSIGRSLYSAIQSPSGFTSERRSAMRRTRYSLTKWSVDSVPFDSR